MAKSFYAFDSPSIVQKIKEGYLFWISIASHIPKNARFSIGARIEGKFLELLELSYIAYFTERESKHKKISECILILDVLKFLVNLSWEAKFIPHKHYEGLMPILNEAGRMLGGWKNSFNNPEKKNRDI